MSCNEGIQYPDAPKDLIPREKMIHLLKEISILESGIQDAYPGVNRFHKTMIRSVDSLFKAEGVTSEQYEQSMDYYSARQSEMAKMYDEAIQQMSRDLGNIEDN